MKSSWVILSLSILSLAFPSFLQAQSFEGIVKQRTVQVEGEGLYAFLYSDGEEEEPDFDSEADWLRYTANKLFQVPIGQLTSGGLDGVTVDEGTMQVKGTKVRFDSGELSGGYMIFDVVAAQTWIVNPAGQYYVSYSSEEVETATKAAAMEAEEAMAAMGIDLEEMRRQAGENEPGEVDAEYGMGGVTPTVRSLNRSETINGFQASAHEAMAGDRVGLGWCGEDVFGLQSTMEKLMEMAGAMEDEEEDAGSGVAMEDLLCEGKIPVRIQTFSPSMGMDGMYSIEEIISIEKASVSEDVFEIPEGFTKKSLADMWGIGR